MDVVLYMIWGCSKTDAAFLQNYCVRESCSIKGNTVYRDGFLILNNMCMLWLEFNSCKWKGVFSMHVNSTFNRE